MIKTVLSDVCVIAAIESKDKLVSFQRTLEEIHQESHIRGVGLQGHTLVKIDDACNGFLAQEFSAIWSRIEKALLIRSDYSANLAEITYEHFMNTVPQVNEVTSYFNEMPEKTGQPNLGTTISSIRRKISDKWNWLASEKKEESRQLAIKIKNNQSSVHDKWLRWCKEKPFIFVTYYIMVTIGAVNGIITSYDFISKQVLRYLGNQ